MRFENFFVLTMVGASFASQDIPIPSKIEGVHLGERNSSFVIEAHLDLLCPGSQQTFFTLINVIKDFQLFEENFLFSIHIFPLPYHTHSFKLSIIEKFIQSTQGEEKALYYIRKVFENQDAYSNDNLSNLTNYQINNMISKDIEGWFNKTISQEDILSALGNGTYDSEARISWKFGCQRSVAGTPTVFVNGIKLNDSWEWNYDDWVQFLQNYFPMKRKTTIEVNKNK